jgi:hypothetical protein
MSDTKSNPVNGPPSTKRSFAAMRYPGFRAQFITFVVAMMADNIVVAGGVSSGHVGGRQSNAGAAVKRCVNSPNRAEDSGCCHLIWRLLLLKSSLRSREIQ